MITVEGSLLKDTASDAAYQTCAVPGLCCCRCQLAALAAAGLSVFKWAQRALVKPTATPSVLPARSGLEIRGSVLFPLRALDVLSL